MEKTNDNANLFGCETQNRQILDYLKNGETLTTLEALRLCGSIRLPSRMQDIGDKKIRWDSAKRCAVMTSTGVKYVSAYFIPDYFGRKHGLSDITEMRTLAKKLTEERLNHR